jgi:hypothetical protein
MNNPQFNKQSLFRRNLEFYSQRSDNNSYQRTLARLAYTSYVAQPTANHIKMLDKHNVTDRPQAIY